MRCWDAGGHAIAVRGRLVSAADGPGVVFAVYTGLLLRLGGPRGRDGAVRGWFCVWQRLDDRAGHGRVSAGHLLPDGRGGAARLPGGHLCRRGAGECVRELAGRLLHNGQRVIVL